MSSRHKGQRAGMTNRRNPHADADGGYGLNGSRIISAICIHMRIPPISHTHKGQRVRVSKKHEEERETPKHLSNDKEPFLLTEFELLQKTIPCAAVVSTPLVESVANDADLIYAAAFRKIAPRRQRPWALSSSPLKPKSLVSTTTTRRSIGDP
uniref:Uncharacterized protein n=1 Tax=Romanomermis culicivorax TaxID=13658 RepID=A0A915JR11_ROMCU